VDLDHQAHELKHQLVARVIGLAAAGSGEALTGRPAECAADPIAVEAELVEDPLPGERPDVAEEEHLARLHVGLGADPARCRLKRGTVGMGRDGVAGVCARASLTDAIHVLESHEQALQPHT